HTRLVSDWSSDVCSSDLRHAGPFTDPAHDRESVEVREPQIQKNDVRGPRRRLRDALCTRGGLDAPVPLALEARPQEFPYPRLIRSEERRVGKEGGCQWSR